MKLSLLLGVLDSPGGAKLWRLDEEEEKVDKQHMGVWGRMMSLGQWYPNNMVQTGYQNPGVSVRRSQSAWYRQNPPGEDTNRSQFMRVQGLSYGLQGCSTWVFQ